MEYQNVTVGKILANVVLCVVIILFFGTNSIIRPLTVGATYKEYVAGCIVVVLFYSNVLILYNRFYLRGDVSKYLLVSLLCILASVGLESLVVYPQIVKDYFSTFDKPYTVKYLIFYSLLLFFRDLGIYFVSFGICNVIHQYRLNAIYEQHLREVRDEIFVEKEVVKEISPEENLDNGSTMPSSILSKEDCQHMEESTAQQVIPSSGFTTISNILYLEQFKNSTLLHTIEESICLRNSTLKKTMSIIGIDNLIRVSKSIAIMKKYLYSFDDLNVKLKNPRNNNIITLDWGPSYCSQALPLLKEMEHMKMETDSDLTENHQNQKIMTSWNVPDLLRHDKINQIYFYISQHPGCKLSEISHALKIPIPTINRILRQLKAEGLITYEGSKKTGGYKVVSS